VELKGWYFLCPKCKTLSKGGDWGERLRNTVSAKVSIIEDMAKSTLLGLDYEEQEIEDTTKLASWHEPCGFYTDWEAEDFMVLIENGKITQWGVYWNDHLEDLENIAKEKGLEIDIVEDEYIEEEEEYERESVIGIDYSAISTDDWW